MATDRQRLLDAIGHVEDARHNPNALGDHGQAVGMFQMWPRAYQDVQRHYSQEFGHVPYTALTGNAALQRQAASRYLDLGQQAYGIQALDRLISFYNAGPRARRGPIINPGYVHKVRTQLGNPVLRKFH